MKNFKIRFIALCATLLLPAIALAASDMFLKLGGVEGETQIVRCLDGACVVAPLAVGKYTVLVCDAKGAVVPTDISFMYAVVSPRDSASGLATGKRQHGSITITKEWGRGTVPGNVITIEEAGTQLAIGVTDEAVEVAQAKITKTRSNIQNN